MPGLPGKMVQLRVDGMALDVAFGPEGGGVLAHERTVVFEPVFAECLRGEFRAAADDIDEFYHLPNGFHLSWDRVVSPGKKKNSLPAIIAIKFRGAGGTAGAD